MGAARTGPGVLLLGSQIDDRVPGEGIVRSTSQLFEGLEEAANRHPPALGHFRPPDEPPEVTTLRDPSLGLGELIMVIAHQHPVLTRSTTEVRLVTFPFGKSIDSPHYFPAAPDQRFDQWAVNVRVRVEREAPCHYDLLDESTVAESPSLAALGPPAGGRRCARGASASAGWPLRQRGLSVRARLRSLRGGRSSRRARREPRPESGDGPSDTRVSPRAVFPACAGARCRTRRYACRRCVLSRSEPLRSLRCVGSARPEPPWPWNHGTAIPRSLDG